MSDKVIHIVDDDKLLLNTMNKVLSPLGYIVKTYDSGELFIKNYKGSKNECLVLDLMMSKLDGERLYAQLAEHQIYLPCIFISGFASVSIAARLMKQGALYILEKPVDLTELVKHVDRALLVSATVKENAFKRVKFIQLELLLSENERKVFHLMKSNVSIKEMATKLYKSPSTIEKQRKSVIEKLGFNNALDLYLFCQQLDRIN